MRNLVCIIAAVFLLSFVAGPALATYEGPPCNDEPSEPSPPPAPAPDPVEATESYEGNEPLTPPGCTDWDIATHGFRHCDKRVIKVHVNGKGFVGRI